MKKEKNSLTLKIFSLLIAIFLWIYVMDEVNPETLVKRNVDLVFSNTDALDRDSLIVKEPKEAKVTVSIVGKKNDIDNFSSKSIKAIVDLEGYTEGPKKVPVKVSLDHQMSNVRIVDYEPKEVLITFDKIVTEEMPIKLKTIGELEDSYVLSDLTSKSETVLIKGPRTWLNEVTEVVGFVDMEGRKKSSSLNIPLRLLDSKGNDVVGVEKSPESISVDLNIQRYKEVPINLKTDQDIPEGFEVKELIINPDKIRLKGDERVLSMKSIDTQPVRLSELMETGEQEIKLDLPDHIELFDKEDIIKAKLKLTEIEEKELVYKAKDLNLLNPNPELDYLIEDDLEISLKIKGEKEAISEFTNGNVALYLDLKGLKEGEHNIKLDFERDSKWQLISISQESVKVEVQNKTSMEGNI